MKAFSKALCAVPLASAVALSGCSTIGLAGHRALRAPASGARAGAARSPGPSGLISELHGGIIGQKIGSELSRSDRKLALEAEYRALEETPGGKPVAWQDPDGSVSGSVVAAPPYQVGSQNCRQYTHTVTIDGTKQEARGAACRNRDGSWTPLDLSQGRRGRIM